MYNTIKRSLGYISMGGLFIFLAFGNLFRLVESSQFSDHLLLSEGILYLLSFLCLIFYPFTSRVAFVVLLLTFLIAVSCVYGMYIQGMDIPACLYAMRLICLLVACLVLHEVSWFLFQGDLVRFFSFLSKAYLLALILGFGLYIFFPLSKHLWIALQDYHISFQGDPHQGRFVSIYFDPNYYACIAALAFLLVSYLRVVTEKRRYSFYAYLFLFSTLLTWSRSGIAAFFLLFFYPHKGNRNKVFLFLFCFSLLAIGYQEEMGIFLGRLWNIFEEESAACRIRTWDFGLSLWREHPLFGIGINFLPLYTREEFGLGSLDSSMLSFLVQVGGLPFLGCLTYCATKIFSFFRLRRLWKEKEPKAPYFYGWFFYYALVIVLFASQFNNILFYPFWVLPFFLVAAFLSRRAALPLLAV
ncbi:MAG: hypothetical protein FJZ58_01685 [Chlamydiae bacterium]|nr:hypothetical protein [Chlamydiota bacterium]